MDNGKKASTTEQMLTELKTPLYKAHEGEESVEYLVETLSECNLKCGLCAFGSREIFERKKGMMDLDLYKKIVQKISSESPHAVVEPYHHSEPMLHPQLPEMIEEAKKYGLTCRFASNFNCSNRLRDILEAGIDSIYISVSGFYQETYQKAHINGKIEKVKENMRLLRELMDRTGKNPDVTLNYHMYKDNLGEEYDKMRKLCDSLGFLFSPSWARSINAEMTLKYLREKGLSRYHGETLSWFDEMPPLTKRFYENMERIVFLPEDYLTGRFTGVQGDECPVNRKMVNIRWNGKLSLCCDTFDDRFTTEYDYLDTPLSVLYKLRKQSPFCRECLTNNYAFYSNYVDMPNINRVAASRLEDDVPDDRRFFGISDSEYENIYRFCCEHDKIYIFGAGKYGKQMAERLREHDIKFEGFLVSEDHISRYDEGDVKSVGSLRELPQEDIGILVALNRQNTKEVKATLNNTGRTLYYVKQELFI